MTQAKPCDPNLVEMFLDGQLTDSQQSTFEEHLTHCDECRKKLEQDAAASDWWTKSSDFLKDDAFDSQLIGADQSVSPSDLLAATQDGEYSLAVGNDSLARVLELLAPSDDPHMLGRLGRYEIVGAVGFGGMAVVLKGFESALNRFVAIKVLAPHLASSKSARSRFSREARAAASVLHPNVIAIHAVSEFKALPFLVMPYIAGGSLQDRLDRDGQLDTPATLRIGMQVASGLAAAHEQGLVHRDIKPANILLESDLERVVITDFGLARAADDASITQTGMLAGTPHYMSPEQAKGERLDQRSDLFSLGSLLYTMTAGRVPFQAETSYGVLRKITDQSAPSIADENQETPSWLAKLINRLHQKPPENRYQTADEVADLLGQCLAATQNPTQPFPPSLITPRPSYHQPWRTATAAVAILAVWAFVSLLWNPNRNQSENANAKRTPTSPIEWPADGEWATLRGRFLQSGDSPEPKYSVPTRDRAHYPDPILDETLIVHPENRGIANVFVWLVPTEEQSKLPSRNQTQVGRIEELRFDQGRLIPHALLLSSTQALKIGNRDPVRHHISLGPNENVVIKAGDDYAATLEANDVSPIAISCQHPWFRSHVLVLDHPYMAVSDANGDFVIEDVPSGRWNVRVWHESIGELMLEGWPNRKLDVNRPFVDAGDITVNLSVDRRR